MGSQTGSTHTTPGPTITANEDEARKYGPYFEVLLINDVFEEREHGHRCKMVSSGFVVAGWTRLCHYIHRPILRKLS